MQINRSGLFLFSFSSLNRCYIFRFLHRTAYNRRLSYQLANWFGIECARVFHSVQGKRMDVDARSKLVKYHAIVSMIIRLNFCIFFLCCCTVWLIDSQNDAATQSPICIAPTQTDKSTVNEREVPVQRWINEKRYFMWMSKVKISGQLKGGIWKNQNSMHNWSTATIHF